MTISMGVPEEIRKVERPKNTVVVAYGKNGDKYAVRSRVGCRYEDGRRIPVEGAIVGHIVDGRYIPVDERLRVDDCGVDLKDWANIELSDFLSKGILEELEAVYNRKDAQALYCMALLRTCYHGIKDDELKDAYDNSFLSEKYPGVALSRNSVSDFHKNVGRACSKIAEFMRNRVSKLQESHHLVIDGTLKSDESSVNSLSNYSRKARTKGTKDVSVLYAYDVEEMEPICSKVYPGNMLDEVAFKDFLSTNAIKKGLIVADKGFTVKSANKVFADNPGLHYLLPLKRNAALIGHYSMYSFEGILEDRPQVTCKKAKIGNERKWLYSFRDASKAAAEEQAYLQKCKGRYDAADHEARRQEFGTIVFESDYDAPCGTVYQAYEERWLIEMVFRYYKDVNEFDETRMHSDYSVISSEFVCFLSTIVTGRLLKRFGGAPSLEDVSYGKAMRVLERAKKVRIDGEWSMVRLTVKDAEVLRDLGLIPRLITVKNPRGRPRKKRDRRLYSYSNWESVTQLNKHMLE